MTVVNNPTKETIEYFNNIKEPAKGGKDSKPVWDTSKPDSSDKPPRKRLIFGMNLKERKLRGVR